MDEKPSDTGIAIRIGSRKETIVNRKQIGRLASLVMLALMLVVLGRGTPSALASNRNAQSGTWRGEYYSNGSLYGNPTLVRNDGAINFNWGYGSPSGEIPSDNFSARWTSDIYFEAGRYRFSTETDDGVRLFVDGALLVDRWQAMPPTQFNSEVELSAGVYTVRMEYFEAGDQARANLWWTRISTAPTAAWRAEYFNNTALSGAPALVRDEPSLDFNWGNGSPSGSVTADRFSARWTRTIAVAPGTYRFTATHDDGIRVWVDNGLVIDKWQSQSARSTTADVQLDGRPHQIRVEYYENAGAAVARLGWAPVPPPPPRVGNLVTCAAPQPSYSWIKVYQMQANGTWLDMKPEGYGSIEATGWLKVDGLPVDFTRYGAAGHPYRVEQWVDGRMVRSIGATERGEVAFRIRADQDNFTPWQCPR